MVTESDDISQSAEPVDNLASEHVKISRSNLGNAKRTYKEIKTEDKSIGRDLHRQDFSDAAFQSMRLEDAAKREAQEAGRLRASQGVKAQEVYARQKRKISNREYKETKRRISHERDISKTAIKGTRRTIRHEKAEKRREDKLKRLQEKAAKAGHGSGELEVFNKHRREKRKHIRELMHRNRR